MALYQPQKVDGAVQSRERAGAERGMSADIAKEHRGVLQSGLTGSAIIKRG